MTSRISQDGVLRLVELVYRAGTQPALWRDALVAIADAAGADEALLGGLAGDASPMILAPRTDPALMDSYFRHYHATNALTPAMDASPAGVALVDHELIDMDVFRAGEFYNDWCRPHGFTNTVAVNLAVGGAGRGALLLSSPRLFEAAQVRLFSALLPHLVQAFAINRLLGDLMATSHGLEDALARTEHGVMLVDAARRIVFANAAAERIMADGGFLPGGGELRCAQRAADDALRALVAGCARGGAGGEMRIGRPVPQPDLRLRVSPARDGPGWSLARQAAAVVLLSDPQLQQRRKAGALQTRFRLTPAEAALAWEIVRSGSRKAAASNRGVSVATARSQLNSIFDKTGVRRQTDLVRLLLSDPDDRESGDPPA